MKNRFSLPLSQKEINSLKTGQQIFLSGTVFTARDQVHKKLAEIIKKKGRLPEFLRGQTVYYCGPTRAFKDSVIGSCGPTTSSRMDLFSPLLIKKGLKVMIGKGRRSFLVRQEIKKHKAIYLVAPAGCGALLSEKVKKAEVICFKELGTEAIYKLDVVDFPVIVAIDTKGKTIFKK